MVLTFSCAPLVEVLKTQEFRIKPRGRAQGWRSRTSDSPAGELPGCEGRWGDAGGRGTAPTPPPSPRVGGGARARRTAPSSPPPARLRALAAPRTSAPAAAAGARALAPRLSSRAAPRGRREPKTSPPPPPPSPPKAHLLLFSSSSGPPPRRKPRGPQVQGAGGGGDEGREPEPSEGPPAQLANSHRVCLGLTPTHHPTWRPGGGAPDCVRASVRSAPPPPPPPPPPLPTRPLEQSGFARRSVRAPARGRAPFPPPPGPPTPTASVRPPPRSSLPGAWGGGAAACTGAPPLSRPQYSLAGAGPESGADRHPNTV
ncbi:basic salivary proline-rich protein 1-like [Trichosurus vulpecula]|uniref:basic salivary proline-rich protein 1-like n=1 Tax=Trichosurus vulpecula TaxID=9337 RepID=UPI00186AD57A|nr:basic salivary proline-rich protein 1-like [Trichosurus vulpecula]